MHSSFLKVFNWHWSSIIHSPLWIMEDASYERNCYCCFKSIGSAINGSECGLTAPRPAKANCRAQRSVLSARYRAPGPHSAHGESSPSPEGGQRLHANVRARPPRWGGDGLTSSAWMPHSLLPDSSLLFRLLFCSTENNVRKVLGEDHGCCLFSAGGGGEPSPTALWFTPNGCDITPDYLTECLICTALPCIHTWGLH